MSNLLSTLKSATIAKIEKNAAINAIGKRTQGKHITFGNIAYMAGNKTALVKLTQVTDVKLVAANKSRNIQKVSNTVCILPVDSAVYTDAIKHTAVGTKEAIEGYVPRESKYNHLPAAYAALSLKSDNQKHYISTIQDKCTRSTFIDADTNDTLTREQVADLCTTSVANKLLGLVDEKINKTHNIKHDVVVRIIKLENVVDMVEITA